MARCEFSQLVSPALWSRLDGAATQVATQVLCQRFDRDIALLGLFGQGLQRDGVQVAAELAGKTPLCRVTHLFRCGDALHGSRGLQRLDRKDGLFPLCVCLPTQAVRLAAGQDFIQHHTQGIHVGAGGDGFTADLLRCRVMQGEGAHFRTWMQGRGLAWIIQQFGDAEIEQAYLPTRCDQDVGRLEVAVHDQVGMCVADRVADLQEQFQACFHRDFMGLAVIGDGNAFHVLQCEIRLAFAADACIQQACDVGVFQLGQDFALAAEAQAQAGIGQARTQQFQCYLALVQAIGA